MNNQLMVKEILVVTDWSDQPFNIEFDTLPLAEEVVLRTSVETKHRSLNKKEPYQSKRFFLFGKEVTRYRPVTTEKPYAEIRVVYRELREFLSMMADVEAIVKHIKAPLDRVTTSFVGLHTFKNLWQVRTGWARPHEDTHPKLSDSYGVKVTILGGFVSEAGRQRVRALADRVFEAKKIGKNHYAMDYGRGPSGQSNGPWIEIRKSWPGSLDENETLNFLEELRGIDITRDPDVVEKDTLFAHIEATLWQDEIQKNGYKKYYTFGYSYFFQAQA